jgi:hypothetical protein
MADVPEEFVLVPREPTAAMALAGSSANHARTGIYDGVLAERIYRAMLAAAPRSGGRHGGCRGARHPPFLYWLQRCSNHREPRRNSAYLPMTDHQRHSILLPLILFIFCCAVLGTFVYAVLSGAIPK